MKSAPSPSYCRRLAILSLAVSLLGLPGVSGAATSSAENNLRLLQAELPVKIDMLHADCDQLAAAVGRVTLDHQSDAPAILRVALTRGIRNLARGETKLSCACAKRIFGVSVAAAPTQASALLDLATEFYPACAAEFAAMMRDYDQVSYDYKDRVIDDKTVVDDKNGPTRSTSNATDPAGLHRSGNDPGNTLTSTSQDPGDLSARDISGLGYSDSYGFGTGFGSGFPGAPGFMGSPPDGGLALPPTPVTAAVNG